MRALVVVFGLLLFVFLVGKLEQLAQLTSLLVLVLFVLYNLRSIILMRQPTSGLPLLGVISAGLLIITVRRQSIWAS